jgi:hypothetical protein
MWEIGPVLAVRDHLQWGTQVIWTYGPLGYIDNLVFLFFRQWLIAVTLTVVLQVALIGILAVLLSIWRVPVFTWLVLAGLIFMPSSAIGVPDLMCLLLGVLLLVIALERSAGSRTSSVCAATAGVVLAAAALIKDSSLLSGAAAIAVFIVLAAVQRCRTAAVAAALGFIGGFLFLWVLAGQNPQNIPAFLRSTLDLAGGYSAAMSLTPGASVPFAGLGAALVLAMGSGVIILWRRGMRSACQATLLLLPVVALEFKEGFVRADAVHEAAFFSVVIVVGGILLAAATSPLMTELRTGLLGTASVAVGICLVFLFGIGMPMPLLSVSATASEYRYAWTLVTDSAARNAQVTSTEARARAFYDLPPSLVAQLATGTVDVLPVDIALVYGYGFAWDPRPVLQSYSAYTTYLDDSDAAHFASATGPDRILFADSSIDGRYPVFDEPATFRTLLQRYRTTGPATATFVVLSRGGQGESGASAAGVLQSVLATPAGTVCGPLGAALPVPERPGQYTFASLRVPYSLAGSVTTDFYKPADLQVQFTVGAAASTSTQPYKLIPATAADGLFVSGYIANTHDLAQVFKGVIATPIRSLRVTSAGPSDYQGTVCASFSTIPLVPQS